MTAIDDPAWCLGDWIIVGFILMPLVVGLALVV